MVSRRGISRRHLLATSAAAGGLALGGISGAGAQGATRIDAMAPELDKIISATEPIRELVNGLGGPLGPVEGPVWWKEGGYLLFSDIHASKRMKYMPGQGVSVFREKTNQANGLTRDLQGRLLACEHETRAATRTPSRTSAADESPWNAFRPRIFITTEPRLTMSWLAGQTRGQIWHLPTALPTLIE
jgi:sugar lactone lactonase YvrE